MIVGVRNGPSWAAGFVSSSAIEEFEAKGMTPVYRDADENLISRNLSWVKAEQQLTWIIKTPAKLNKLNPVTPAKLLSNTFNSRMIAPAPACIPAWAASTPAPPARGRGAAPARGETVDARREPKIKDRIRGKSSSGRASVINL